MDDLIDLADSTIRKGRVAFFTPDGEKVVEFDLGHGNIGSGMPSDIEMRLHPDDFADWKQYYEAQEAG